MERSRVISELADLIAVFQLSHPVRVGIDGVDCAGKTVLADELAEGLRLRGRTVIRASIDGFHNPRAVRYRQGRDSSKGYYEDSFDLDAMLSCILLPLGPKGNRKYRAAQFDFRTDAPVESPWQVAPVEAVLVFEGVFLHRPELVSHWDFTVFVDTSFEVAIQRAFTRDQSLFQTEDRTREHYQQRYIPGQELYLSMQQPVQRENVVLRNDDIRNPELVINRPAHHALEATS